MSSRLRVAIPFLVLKLYGLPATVTITVSLIGLASLTVRFTLPKSLEIIKSIFSCILSIGTVVDCDDGIKPTSSYRAEILFNPIVNSDEIFAMPLSTSTA